MARKSKQTEAPAVVETDEVDYTKWADKEPTDLQERFAEWIPEVTGYDPSTAKNKQEAFEEGVRLATALRMPFQRSPENQKVLAARREEIQNEQSAKLAKREAKAAKKSAKAKAEPEDDGSADAQLEAPRKRKAAKKAVRVPAAPAEESEAETEAAPAKKASKKTRRAARRGSDSDAAF